MFRQLLAAAALLLPFGLASCSVEASFSSGGDAAGSDSYGVTGGGFRVATGEPTLFYGTSSNATTRRYTYLVIARDLLEGEVFAAQSNSGSASSDGKELKADHTMEVNGETIRAAFAAAVGERGFESMVTTVNGREFTSEQWLFLFDPEGADGGLTPLEAEMPELPMALGELDAFTVSFAEELAKSNAEVKAFLGGS